MFIIFRRDIDGKVFYYNGLNILSRGEIVVRWAEDNIFLIPQDEVQGVLDIIAKERSDEIFTQRFVLSLPPVLSQTT